MKSIRQIDQFAKDVGIRQDAPCEMCDLLHIDIERQKGETVARDSRMLFLILQLHRYESRLRTFKLASAIGFGLAVMFAYASVHRG